MIPSDPFEFTGLDTAGPVTYKVGKATRKGHILVFTCATTRGVALEFIGGLSVENVTLGLRRFFSHHGLPKTIQSDNHKTFKRCHKELDAIMRSPKMEKYLGDHRVVWKRYLERSPWWGGYIERQVQTVKRSMLKVLGSASLNFEEYSTLLYEIAALINSRPIIYVDDVGDGGEPISPSMLITGRSPVQVPPFYEVNVDRNPPQMCRERLKYLEKLKNYFWNRWTKEYLAELREIHSRRKVGTGFQQPSVGEVVLVKGEKTPRGTWKVGPITEVVPGRDGLVRSCRVRVIRGKRNNTLRTKKGRLRKIKIVELNRSPRHLIPLVSASEE